MRIIVILALCILSSGKMLSQNSFYLIPTINTKFGVSGSNAIFHYSNQFPKNEYFTFKNNSPYFSKEILLGIGAGWKNKKQGFFLEFNWNMDGANISNETIFLSTINSTENYYINNNLIYSGGVATHRFSLNIKKYLFKNSIYLNIGTGLTYFPHEKNYKFEYETEPFLYDSNTTFNVKNTSRAVEHYNFNLSLGLSADIKWNKFYLFSIDLFYSQGFKKNLLVHDSYYEIQNTLTNDVKKYSYGTASKGSGFYFQISRRFQLYPWIPLNKKKRLTQENSL